MVVRNNQRLVAAMKERGKPVVYIRLTNWFDVLESCASPVYYRSVYAVRPLPKVRTEHREESWGNEVVEGLKPETGDLVLTKKTHSAFVFTRLHRLLRNPNVDTCIVTGGSMRACACDTVRDGIASGYQMVPISDATYPPNSPYLKVLADRTYIMTTEEVQAAS